ncbi:MAG: DUF4292 domain-containing protein [Bacteroidales bacterium]
MHRISKYIGLAILLALGTGAQQCKSLRKISPSPKTESKADMAWDERCLAVDTIRSFLISKAEALLTYDNERYEVTLSLYSRKDSILYLSAVNSGYEILRASVDHDTIRVIDRMNKVVYRTPLTRQFGYKFPVNFEDLQRISSVYYLCGKVSGEDAEAGLGEPDHGRIELSYDQPYIKKRIALRKNDFQMDIFEFYQQQTGRYLMGERIEDGYRIFSNLVIADFEIVARGGTISYNREVEVKMEVNPRRYTFIDLQ